VKDPGIRDEHGLEPIDDLFSSPEKPQQARNGVYKAVEMTMEAEEDADLGESKCSFRRFHLFLASVVWQVLNAY
jgi:hypothetical protein